ncbi:M50 family metallopeptidase [uncultured Bifidobacterium sp.]|uniref:M50 family metallopeptidase n=1 Tax=uncultured Bifidobacterium sp. TaxID=165187 RepID=UPI0028DB33B6|nr:M50 family metallopeptidase [uncultured Bifidobacterium sp.]
MTLTIMDMIGTVLETVWTASATRSAAPSSEEVITCVILALLAVAVTPLWRITRNAITIAHEGGHALAAKLTGRRLQGVALHADTSGVTVSSGRSRGPGLALTRFAGYASPPLWGLGCSALVAAGYPTAALWLLVILLVLLLVRIRNGYGLLAVLAALLIVIGVSWWGDERLRTMAACTLAWFLLLGALRPLAELQHQRRTGQAQGSDADQLGAGGIPAGAWILLWALMGLGALWLGGTWMTATFGGYPGLWAGIEGFSL